MKLFEMKELPRNAGSAKLRFYDPNKRPELLGNDGFVMRQGKEVFLPNKPFAEFYPLQRGQQFLFRIPSSGEHVTGHDHLFFAGQDEEPFCVRLSPEAFRSFYEGGESAFYSSLVPDGARSLSKEISNEPIRQGDIFAVSLKMPWEEVSRMTHFATGRSLQNLVPREISVHGTRHMLKGRVAESVPILGGHYTVGQGLLEAPDHAPKKLEQVHVLFQTQHLFEPKNAD